MKDPPFGFLRYALNLGHKGHSPCIMIDRARNVTVKIAIWAFRGAKRPMDVQAKAARFPVFKQNSFP
jgi:hypothetical protein